MVQPWRKRDRSFTIFPNVLWLGLQELRFLGNSRGRRCSLSRTSGQPGPVFKRQTENVVRSFPSHAQGKKKENAVECQFDL